MRCTRAEKLIPLHVAGDLNEGRARAVATHLATCAACRGVAGEYGASREMVRAASAPPEFDEAFYEQMRAGVLAQIKRDRTPAPPPRSFASLFNTRLAYAAALAVLVIAGALSLRNFSRRTTGDDAQQPAVVAVVNNNRAPAPTETPTIPKLTGRESLNVTTPRVERRERAERTQRATRRSPAQARQTPPHVEQNLVASTNAATRRVVGQEIAGGEASAKPEVSRIEIQTSDPNIRIIWLAAKTDAPEPLK
ncbi:MAG TPA: zf-HC2 domain-containing protein [Pyrinomonadaceae bacterium]|nr:zf-HC2 domain-containing protein [Pyrinomonadaceae bacterium]